MPIFRLSYVIIKRNNLKNRVVLMAITKHIERIPSYIQKKDHRFYVFCNYMFIFAFIGHILFLPIFYIVGHKTVFFVNLIATIIDYAAFRLNQKGYIKLAPFLWLGWIYIHTINSIVTLGWDQGYYYYLLSMVIVVFFSRWSFAIRIFSVAFLCITSFYMFVYSNTYPPLAELSNRFSMAMFFFNLLANFLAIAYAAFYYRRYAEYMEQKLLTLAHTDPLTGISNRRSFESAVSEKIRYSRNYALLLLDVDFFKKINDAYGHAVGDLALQKVASLCTDSLRKGDVLGRIGGEEFAIFLDGVDKQEALQIAERIREKFEKKIFHINQNIQLQLTVSIGVAIPKSLKDDLPSLMIYADRALYQGKEIGRNRVILFS